MTKDSAGERLTREKHAATAVARAGERLELEQQTTTRITRKQCSALVRVWELNRTGLSCRRASNRQRSLRSGARRSTRARARQRAREYLANKATKLTYLQLQLTKYNKYHNTETQSSTRPLKYGTETRERNNLTNCQWLPAKN